MAPTTRRGQNTPTSNTNPNNMTPESVQAMIDQALLRNSTNGDGSHSSHEDNRRNVQTARPCFYADFMKCQPLNFKGTEGVVGLTRWIEKMESVFNISGCAIENQVKFATCTLPTTQSLCRYFEVVMSSASSAVTLTSVYTDSEPGRVFWGADEEVYAQRDPRILPVPQDEDEHEPMFIQAHDPDYVLEPIYPEYIPLEDEHVFPVEEQPLSPVVSPTAKSPGYVVEIRNQIGSRGL
ncbi:hypothetical protein Tco_0724097 [Tanacetum coccineum]